MKIGDQVKILAVEGLMGPEYIGAIGTIREKVKKKFNVYVDDGNFFELSPKTLELVEKPVELAKEDTTVFAKPLSSATVVTNVVKPVLTEATKHDGSKVPVELLPTMALEEVAKVLDFGRRKYDSWNWAKGFKWTRLIGAAIRHIYAYQRGEDKDPESGLSHVAHAACCVLFLLQHELSSLGEDDRFKGFKKKS